MRSRHIARFYSGPVLATLGLLLTGGDLSNAATNGEAFASPELAARALVSAAESGDVNRVIKVLGPSAKELLTTSDPVADRQVREEFAKRAKVKMVVVADPQRPTQRILEVGADRWPLPIPIVRVADKWRFDLEQGAQQVVLRRIGGNELTAIELCRGYVEAQNEYFERTGIGHSVRQYAQKFISSPGQHDGLYWPSTHPNDESPISELIAKAVAEGYTNRKDPYHGYYFKILKGQGPHVTGGSMSYLKGEAMTRGFAMIAWPADYRSTGITTFLVDRTGIVYQKDLGKNTDVIARATNVYDPDESWATVSGSGVPKTSLVTRRRPSAHR
jgi:hypothetical protein